MRCTWILALGVAFAGPAFAQGSAPATDAGAKALANDLAAYVSQAAFDRKIVTVTPEGNGYRITFAPNAAIQPMLEAGAKVEVAPISVLVAERGDGDWDVSSADPLGVAFDVTVDGTRQTGDYRIRAGRYSGVYSPRLGAFLSASGEYPGMTMTTSDPASDIEATFGRITYEATGTDVGGGAVDMATRQTLAGLSEKVTVKGDPAEGEAPQDGMVFDIASRDIAIDTELKGLKSRAILDLWAFAVAYPDKETMTADQERLRGLLNAALPLLTALKGTYAFNGFDVASELGSVKAEKMAFGFGGGGISTSSAFGYTIGFDGLAVRSPMMPAWAAGLTPEALSLTFKVAGVDLETPARKAIADFDLATPDVLPPATREAIASAFALNPPRLTLEPSRLKTRDAEVTVQGDVLFAGERPEVNMTVEATGIDKVIATLQGQASSDPSLNEVVGGLQLAKGFAKALPGDRSQWIVTVRADGSVVLNGAQIVAPTPPAPETGPAPTDDNAMPSEAPSNAPGDAPAQ